MRIVFVLWQGHAAGAEILTVGLAAKLTAMGHPTAVVIIGTGEDTAELLVEQSIPHTAMGLSKGRDVLLGGGALARAAREYEPDICVLPNNGYLVPLIRHGGLRCCLVAMEHGSSLNPWVRSAPQRVADRVGRYFGKSLLAAEIAVSTHAKQSLLALPHAGVIDVVPNGVDLELFFPAASAPELATSERVVRYGCASRLVKGKGVGLALRSFARLADSRGVRDGIELHVAGEGPLRGELERMAVELGAANHVKFHGKVRDMPAFWRALDVGIFVTGEWVESFGLSAVEAAACGAKVLLTDTAGMHELWDGYPHASFVEGGHLEALSLCLQRLAMEGPATGADRQIAHRWVAERFSLQACAVAYERLFKGYLESGS